MQTMTDKTKTRIMVEDLPEAILNHLIQKEQHTYNASEATDKDNYSDFGRVEVSLLASLRISEKNQDASEPTTVGLILEVFLISGVILLCMILIIGVIHWWRSLHRITYRILTNARPNCDQEQPDDQSHLEENAVPSSSNDGVVMNVPLLEVPDI